ncbi:MAG: [FeFe] hydrogenase H-cluster radical SAM maturase HydE [Syntrophomonadaceae bacterium]|nr:[FeFe] hydrogenase H-cluster radical SAM maturase HydE [Syntrophomonadaceae bacterium]MDH7497131.1 [FeFe] hydrogenase H-cluster radical SAM maturase HydE [Syntrophomonadaceae bacterium]
MSERTLLERLEADPPTLSRSDIIQLLASTDAQEIESLFCAADRVRRRGVGDQVHLRAIIEFSNHCVRRCAYCGINRGRRDLVRYRMAPEEIVATARRAARAGFRTVVLQSGDDFHYSRETVADIIRAVKSAGVAVTLSLGERPFQDYRLWRQAGADRYLLKFETADAALYARLHPGQTLAQRLRCLEELASLGYQTGSGNIVGLPGQALQSLADDLLLMRSLGVEMAAIGPFVPHPSTPLSGEVPGETGLVLRVLALARLLMPRVHLPATTALGTVAGDGRARALRAGANVLMLDVTPAPYREHYEIYPGKGRDGAGVEQAWQQAGRWLAGQGRPVAQDAGDGHLAATRAGMARA